MHSLNEVLFGAMLGLFSMVSYYIFIERFMVKLVATLIGNKCGFKYFVTMAEQSRKKILLFILFWVAVVAAVIDFVVAFVKVDQEDIKE